MSDRHLHCMNAAFVFLTKRRRIAAVLSGIIVCWACCSLLAFAQGRQIRLVHDSDVVEVEAVAPNIVRFHIEPGGKTSPRTLVIDPSLQTVGLDRVRVDRNGPAQTLSSPEMRVVVIDAPTGSIQVQDSNVV